MKHKEFSKDSHRFQTLVGATRECLSTLHCPHFHSEARVCSEPGSLTESGMNCEYILFLLVVWRREDSGYLDMKKVLFDVSESWYITSLTRIPVPDAIRLENAASTKAIDTSLKTCSTTCFLRPSCSQVSVDLFFPSSNRPRSTLQIHHYRAAHHPPIHLIKSDFQYIVLCNYWRIALSLYQFYDTIYVLTSEACQRPMPTLTLSTNRAEDPLGIVDSSLVSLLGLLFSACNFSTFCGSDSRNQTPAQEQSLPLAHPLSCLLPAVFCYTPSSDLSTL